MEYVIYTRLMSVFLYSFSISILNIQKTWWAGYYKHVTDNIEMVEQDKAIKLFFINSNRNRKITHSGVQPNKVQTHNLWITGPECSQSCPCALSRPLSRQ